MTLALDTTLGAAGKRYLARPGRDVVARGDGRRPGLVRLGARADRGADGDRPRSADDPAVADELRRRCATTGSASTSCPSTSAASTAPPSSAATSRCAPSTPSTWRRPTASPRPVTYLTFDPGQIPVALAWASTRLQLTVA
jgi:hypothetical protein